MQYIGTTKHIVTVDNSVGVTLGGEAAGMNKSVRDEIGVIVLEPKHVEEAVSLLSGGGRCFVTVGENNTLSGSRNTRRMTHPA